MALCLIAAACSNGGGVPDAGKAADPGITTSDNVCNPGRSVGALLQAEVLVVFDRSESMASGFGAVTRYQAMAAALEDITSLYEGHIRFGLAAFPSPGPDCAAGCCAGGPLVDVALDNAAAVKNGLAALLPLEGQTPTAAALNQARQYFASLPDDGLSRYVLLVTDGWPTCGLDGRLSAGPLEGSDAGAWPACEQAASQAGQLFAMGVPVIVLGLGTEGGTDTRASCLDSLALAGGAARSPSHPAYYSVQTPDELQYALEAIFGGVTRPSCLLRFVQTQPLSPYVVKVYLDDQEIPRDREAGWDFEPPNETTQVRLFGEYCRRAEHFQFSRFEVRFSCPVI